MIPYSYNMVNMGGLDLAEANGTVVEGLYNRLALARNACGDLILYNWKFAGIEITPGICETLDAGTSILINGLIQVTEQDEVTVLGIDPPPEPVEPLTVNANGVYTAQAPLSGFNPVDVRVPMPTLGPLSVSQNGVYTPSEYSLDGFDSVTVQTPTVNPRIIPFEISGYTYLDVSSGNLIWSNTIAQRVFAATLDPGEYIFVRDQDVNFNINRYNSAVLLNRMSEVIEKSLEPAEQATILFYLGGSNSFSGKYIQFTVGTRTAVLFYKSILIYTIDPIIYKIS